VFIEFSEQFYPTFLGFPDSETEAGQRMYYDAAYAQNTTNNILGLFAVGEQAQRYQNYLSNNKVDYLLNELDRVFDGKASENYVKHLIQNWDNEPFIHSAYLADVSPSYIPAKLAQPINQQLYFAGEAYTTHDDWGGVHNATQSARRAVEEIIRSEGHS